MKGLKRCKVCDKVSIVSPVFLQIDAFLRMLKVDCECSGVARRKKMANHQRLRRQGEHSHSRRSPQVQTRELALIVGIAETLERG